MGPLRPAVKTLAATARRLVRHTGGATALEYGLILALIVLAIMASLYALGSSTTIMWNGVAAKVAAAR